MMLRREMAWALIDFAAWCYESGGNQASTISVKFAVMQYFHIKEAQIEIDMASSLINCAFEGHFEIPCGIGNAPSRPSSGVIGDVEKWRNT